MALPDKDHNPALDGLRGLAILLVIPHNTDIYAAIKNWTWPLALVAHAGWIGVQLFFVLSGYLITRNLLRDRGASNYFTMFYGRRVLRIFPLYYLVLVAFLVVLPRLVTLTPEILESYRYQTWLWVFLNNWAQPVSGNVHWFPHFWSLAVEEQFYLIWPWVILRVPERNLATVCLGIVLVAIASRLGIYWTLHNPDMVYMFTCTRMDALALGALAAVHARNPGRSGAWATDGRGLLFGGVALLGVDALASRLFDTHSQWMIGIGYTVLALSGALLLLATNPTATHPSCRAWRRILSSAFLRTVGQYSYAMYVFHLLITLTMGAWIRAHLTGTGTALAPAYTVVVGTLSFGAAFLSYHLIEKHFLRLKRYFQPRRDSAHDTAPAT
jgi:peptidoglycan/LPS O-acetylase OafA/YrhL